MSDDVDKLASINPECPKDWIRNAERETMEFKVGDKVDWLGLQGRIVAIYGGDSTLPIEVRFSNGTLCSFRSDGSFLKGQPPTLKVIERPKRTVKKKVWVSCASEKPENYNSIPYFWGQVEVEVIEE